MTLSLLVLAAIMVFARRSGPAGRGDDYDRYHGKVFRVARVVDGDTMDLDALDGGHSTTRVRLWGVDTPEVAASGRGEMYYGPEASAFAKSTLEGRDVEAWLIRGKTRDKFGRLLAYLKRPEDDVTFNERLIQTGHAYADWRFDHPSKEQFLADERRARRGHVGLWASVRPEQMPGWRQRGRDRTTTSTQDSRSRGAK